MELAVSLALSVLLAQRTVSDAEVQKVHRSAIIIDTHNDITSRTVQGFDIGKPATDTHTDLPRMKRGGQTAEFFAVYVAGSYVEGNRSAHRALEMIDTVRHDIIGRYPNDFVFATTADDIVRAKKTGKIAALLGIEGGHAIEDSLRLLRSFHALGVRYMTLTHSNSNNWAGSSGDSRNTGLTDLGRQVVREMNRLGMLVDISHVSDKTFWDVLEVSTAPPFASHSSCRALANIPRNMSDDMIQALARKGGVVQINFGCDFLSQKAADASASRRGVIQKLMQETDARLPMGERRAAAAKKMEELGMKPVRATLADIVAHIDHIRKLTGSVDAIGIGSDFDGVGCVPEGLASVAEWPNLTRALLEKGYSAEEIRKIWGGNLLRVMRAAESRRGL
jgi:membrane dipeptidase